MPSLRRSWAIALVLLIVDAFLLNQGFVALCAVLGIVFIRLPSVLFALKDPPLRRNRLCRAGIYALMSAAILACNALNNRHARRQAERLIAALQRHNEAQGTYPASLEGLVPAYLPAVPRAKFTAEPWRSFRYIAMPNGNHWLEYTALPPFGRPHYILEERRWGYLD